MKKMLKIAILLLPIGLIIPAMNYIVFGDIMNNFLDCFAYVYLPIILIIVFELVLFIVYRRCLKK